MNKSIYVDPYDPATYDAAIKEIKAYKKWVKKKTLELCKKLAELGLEVAQIYFIPEAWNGNTDVTLTVEPLNNGYMLKASGEDVCFMEFGAGVTAGLGYDTSKVTPPVPIEKGSWSSTQGTGKFMKDGYRWYNGQMMDAITPQMGMSHAVSEIQQRVTDVAREVFG